MGDFADAVRLICEEAAGLLGVQVLGEPSMVFDNNQDVHKCSLDMTSSMTSMSSTALPCEVRINNETPVVKLPSIFRRSQDEIGIGEEVVGPPLGIQVPSIVERRPQRVSARQTSLHRQYNDGDDDLDADDDVDDPLYRDLNIKLFDCKTASGKIDKNANNSNNSQAPYACEQCRRRFKRKESLQRHITTHDEKAFVCDVCDQTLSSALSLREHRAIHDNELLYECSQCLRKFRQNSCLRRHLLTHSSKTPPHDCPTCGRRFTQNTYLRSHMRCHTGEKPFRCMTCNKSFGHRSTLKRHQMTHTGDRPYACDSCSATFADASSWRRHLRKHKLNQQELVANKIDLMTTTTTTNNTTQTGFYGATKELFVGEEVGATSMEVDYVRNPDFAKQDYFDWLSDFIDTVRSSHLPMEDMLFAKVCRVHSDVSDVLATPCGPLSHDREAFLSLVSMSQQLHAVVQNHRSFCSPTSDIHSISLFNTL